MTNELLESVNLRDFLDPKYHILEKFRELAPGSDKHCQNVMALCESVAMDLGMSSDVIKVAARYHDIGKMNNPEAYSENQNGSNIHDNLDPMISYQLITRHVGDSILYLLQIENMPKKVLEIISQHHGNTILRFFYDKSGAKIENIYRYKCEQPTSLEAAILMICDVIEATARSLSINGQLDKTPDRTSVVNKSIQRLMDDGQLDNMKVGELKVVKKTLTREMESIYHKRVVYGDEKEIGTSNSIV